MADQTYLPAPRVSKVFPPLLFRRMLSPRLPRPRCDSARHIDSIAFPALQFRRPVALLTATLLLLAAQGEVLAQQVPYYGPTGSPYQQTGYSQPPLSGQPAYSQPPYTQFYPQRYPTSSQSYLQQGYTQPLPSAQPLNARRLEQLVAPIALYPDTLVAQVLSASTYPLQVVDADRWRQAQGSASSDQLAAGANLQPWDPSVKAMTAFPQVLAEMDQNLQWTTELGNAYYNQPQEIFAAVQIMRQRAQAAGNLQNTPQQAVSYNQGNIQLAPVNSQTVYVPSYNPWSVYGDPVSPYPGFSLLDTLGSFFGSSPVKFGLGMAMAAFSHMSWGWLGWGLNWLAHTILFQQSDYSSQSTTVADWGLPYGGPRAFSQRGWRNTTTNNYYRASVSYGQPGGYNRLGNYGTQSFMRSVPYPYGGNRPADGYNRGYQGSGGAYSRPSSQEAYNRIPPTPARPQQYGRPTYGSFNGRPGDNYGSRPGAAYAGPFQARSAPPANMQRGFSGKQSSNSFMGNGFGKSSAKPPHAGGFHPFGGGHAPKGFGGGKSFGGHSRGGGGHGGGKHHFL
jgi:hypothetical protein